MFPLRPAHGPQSRPANHHVMVAWDKIITVALGIMMLAVGTLFLPHVTTQFGLFPTLFIAAVVVGCVLMHVREHTPPPKPQS